MNYNNTNNFPGPTDSMQHHYSFDIRAGTSAPAAPSPTSISKRANRRDAILNDNVKMWAAFFALALSAYFVLSGGNFSFLMTFGAMSRMFGFGILNAKIYSGQGNTAGISCQTLLLYIIVFSCRISSIIWHEGYLPYDKSGDWLYHLIEIMALIFCVKALWSCITFQRTNHAVYDKVVKKSGSGTTQALYLAVPTLVIAIFIHPNLNREFLSDVAWTYAMYLESVSLVPQLYKFQKQKAGPVDILTAHFVAALGFGRILEFVFWAYSHKELATAAGSKMPGYLALLAQFMQLVLMLEFFWYYHKAVKNSTPLVLPTYGVGFGEI